MKWTAITRHRAGTTFVLAFFMVFVLLGGCLCVGVVRVYQGIDSRAQGTFALMTPLEYLSGAVRRADTKDGLAVVSLPAGGTALSVKENDRTWLYFCREGYLYKQDSAKAAVTAERLCEADHLKFRVVQGMIRVECRTANGVQQSLLLSPRTGFAGGDT